MKKKNNKKQNEESPVFKVRIIEHLCSDSKKLSKLMDVFHKYNMQLATYL